MKSITPIFSMKSALLGLKFLSLAFILIFSSCKEPAAPDERIVSPGGPVLRYTIPLENRDVFLDLMVRQCRSMGIKEVFLFTRTSNKDYASGNAFYDDEEFERRMEHFRYCADRIRKEGLIPSIEVLHTLGHIRVNEDIVQRFGFERQLTRDGKPNLHPVLDPRSPGLREHLAKNYAQYASLKPERLFVNDDFWIGMSGCFNEGRVKEFAGIVGCEPSRDAVAELIYNNDPEIAARMQKIMWDLINRDLEELAQIIEKAVHEVSPETKIGPSYIASFPNDAVRIAKILAGKHKSFVRLQIGLYREDMPVTGYPQAFWGLSCWLSKLPSDFQILPEPESFPHTNFSKSPEATYAQIASIFGRGIGSPAYNLVEKFRNQRTIDFLSDRKDQVEKVTDLLKVQSRPEGIRVWNIFNSSLELLGLPFKAVSEPEDGDVIFGSRIKSISDNQLGDMVTKGAIFDMDAMKVLDEKGFLAKMGVHEFSQCDRSKISTIDFMDGKIPDLWNIYYFIRNLPGEAWPMEFKAANEIRINSYKNDEDEVSVPYAVKWTGPEGQRFGFINFSYDKWPIYAWLNPWMVGIMNDLAGWVRNEAVPARVKDSPRVAVEMCETGDGKVLLALINYSTGSYDDVALTLSEKLGKMKWIEITASGKERHCKVSKIGSEYEMKPGNAIPSLGVKFFVGK